MSRTRDFFLTADYFIIIVGVPGVLMSRTGGFFMTADYFIIIVGLAGVAGLEVSS